MSRPKLWDQERRDKALELRPIGREILNSSTQHRLDKNTILLKRRMG